MSKIITVSREFGSGGRELGKRLSEALGIPCYDHEIVDLIAERQGLDSGYVARVSESDYLTFYPTTIGHRFSIPAAAFSQSVSVSLAQRTIIEELASRGDCVIVGRCADIILADMHPLNLFVYADQESKVKRCQKRAAEGQSITVKEIVKKMKQIDKSRTSYRAFFTDEKWGQRGSYHLCINTSNKEIKTLIPAIAQYARLWFGEDFAK